MFFVGCSNSTTESGGGASSGGGTGDNDGTTITPNPPEPTSPVLQNISDSFSGVRVVYSSNQIVDENGVKKSFTELLDRQFDVLAEDILYRLYITYGKNTYGESSTFGDLVLNSGNYAYEGNSAIVKKDNLLTEEDIHGQQSNIDCIACYQTFVNEGENVNTLSISTYIIVENAISGGYHNWSGILLDSTNANEYMWQFNDYSLWNTTYRDEFKLALAKIVYGDENSTLSYDELLSKINRLGFDASAEEKIVNYINNSVIGTNLIEENLRIYNMFSESEKSNLKNWTNVDEIEKHYYKGYNIVVPAIVKQALGNTFENTSVSLYPEVSNKVSVVSTFDNLKSEKDYKEIVLMPNNSSVLVTAIPIKIWSTNSVNKKVTIKATVRNAAGKLISDKTVGSVTLSAEEKMESLTFTCANTIGAYTGSNTSFDEINMFNYTSNNIDLGSNYVQLTFVCDDDVTFGVEFLGMYNEN